MSIRVLVIADVRLYREGLATLLLQSGRIAVVAAVGSAAEAAGCIAAADPEVVLLDMTTPGALGCVAALVAEHPGLRIVALAVPETTSDVIACAEAGAVGYVPREGSVEDVVGALEAAARGELRCSARIAATLLRRVAELSRASAAQAAAAHLTPRERDVLRLLQAGRSNKEIARTLGIELATAKNHVHHILEKLDVRGRAQAAVAAAPWIPRTLDGRADAGPTPAAR